MGGTRGGSTRQRTRRVTGLRARDVVPAAVSVVLLLGVGGCMGALGGGPLDGSLMPRASSISVAPSPSPSTLVAPSSDVAVARSSAPRPGGSPDASVWHESLAAADALVVGKPFFRCETLVPDGGATPTRTGGDCLARPRVD